MSGPERAPGAIHPSPRAPEPDAVRGMFERLAGGYDRFNRLASLGRDRLWRAALIRRARRGLGSRTVVLDLGTGTSDLIFDFLSQEGECRRAAFIGMDFSGNMLARGAEKHKNRFEGRGDILFLGGDAQRIPLAAASVDCIVSAFVLRNLKKVMRQALAEAGRVLKPGGRIYLLEMFVPENEALRLLHRFYLKTVLAWIGKAVFGRSWSGDYLAETIFDFWSPGRFCEILTEAGFEGVCALPLHGGIAVLHEARKHD